MARFVLRTITKNCLSFRTIPLNGPDRTENWQDYLGSKQVDLKKRKDATEELFRKTLLQLSRIFPKGQRTMCEVVLTENPQAPLPGRGGQTAQRESCCEYFQDYGCWCYKAYASC